MGKTFFFLKKNIGMKSIKQHTLNFKASSVTKPTVAIQVSETKIVQNLTTRCLVPQRNAN